MAQNNRHKSNELYTNESLEELLKTMDEKADLLSNSLKGINKHANAIIRQFNQFFSGSLEEVNQILSSNDDLRQLHDDLVQHMSLLNQKINDNANILHTLSETYHVSENDIQQHISNLVELKKLEERVYDLSIEVAQAQTATDADRAAASQIDAMNEAEALKRKMKSSKIGEQILKEYQDQNDELIKSVDAFDDMSKATNDISAQGKRFQSHIAKAKKDSQELQKNIEKTTENISNALQEVYRGLVKVGSDALAKFKEINQGVHSIGREMGLATSQIALLQSNVFSNYGEIANRLGMEWQEIAKFQAAYTANTGKSLLLANDTVEKLGILSKYSSEESVNQMVNSMDNFAMSADNATDIFALNMARAANQGLNLKVNSEQFAKNIKMASTYTFSRGVDGISRMTLLSQKLKFNFESMSSALDKFSNIEDAITTSASIQVLGGQYASHFSNPLTAMGQALTDAEGFTENLIKAIGKSAYFDTRKGMVDMSPLEKAKLKSFANSTGINYQELWNAASQQAKIDAIDKYTRGRRFNEDQKAFLANRAEFNKETKTWFVRNANMSNIDLRTISEQELVEIQKQNDVEETIQGDVRSIKNSLNVYLNRLAKDDKTLQEALKGLQEQVKIGTANAIDKTASGIIQYGIGQTHGISDLSAITTLGTLGGLSILGKSLMGGKLREKGSDLIGKLARLRYRGRTQPPVINQGGTPVPTPAPTATPRSPRWSIPSIGKPMIKTTLKSIGAIGAVGTMGWQLYNVNQEYKQKEQAINRSNISYDDKIKAIDKLHAERRQDRIDAVVGGSWTSATLQGAGIGAMFGPWGALIGGAIGAGAYGIRQLFKNKSDEENQVETPNIEGNEEIAMNNDTLSKIQLDVSRLRESSEMSLGATRSIVKSNTFSNTYASVLPPKDVKPVRLQYETTTKFNNYGLNTQSNSNSTISISPTKIDLNMNGQIKLVSDNKSTKLDIKDIMDNTSFKNELIKMISEELNKKGNLLGILNKESAVTRYHGVANPLAKA